MTEEIIIDCAFYKDGVCASPINKTCEYCKNIDVSKCYHKQLKKLELENKELGRKAFLAEQNVRTTAATFCEKDNKINELEQENKELLEKFDEAQEDIKSLTDATNYYFKENEELKNIINVKAFEINNYKLALKEIMQISKESYYMCDNCEKQRKEENCNDKCNAYRLKEIRDKVNGVLND